jgi:CDP-diglyceride synthetase
MSLTSHFFASRLGHYVIAVLVTWLLIFAIGYFFHGPTPGRPALHAFAGFLPGMLAMYVATRLYGTPQHSISQFFRSRFDMYVIGVFVAWILLFVIGYYFYGPTRGHPALQVFGGFLLGMLAMYIATHVYGMP